MKGSMVIDALAISGALHTLVIMGVMMLGTGIALILQSRTAFVLSVAVGAAFLI